MKTEVEIEIMDQRIKTLEKAIEDLNLENKRINKFNNQLLMKIDIIEKENKELRKRYRKKFNIPNDEDI